MPLNIPGLLVPFHLLWNPRIVLPHVIVRDIRQLDFLALRKAGYRGAVFDKDNCVTIPYGDALVPQLEETWKECRQVFGEENVLIVSNSAGTKHDAGQVQAESVMYHLSVPVLRHDAPKPAYSCIESIRRYFSTLGTPIKDNELVIVGDRIFTDVVMANRMRYPTRRSKGVGKGLALENSEPLSVSTTGERGSINPMRSSEGAESGMERSGPLAVWTTGVWQRESMVVRWLEKRVVNAATRWTDDAGRRSAFQTAFAKPLVPQLDEKKETIVSRVWNAVHRK